MQFATVALEPTRRAPKGGGLPVLFRIFIAFFIAITSSGHDGHRRAGQGEETTRVATEVTPGEAVGRPAKRLPERLQDQPKGTNIAALLGTHSGTLAAVYR